MCSHAWPQMLNVGVCEPICCIYRCLLFWDIVKILHIRYFGNFGHAWPCPSKMIVSSCRKLLCLSAGKKSTPSFTSFNRYCKRYCELVILGTLGIPGQTHSESWYKHLENFNAYLHEKIDFITHFFLKLLEK